MTDGLSNHLRECYDKRELPTWGDILEAAFALELQKLALEAMVANFKPFTSKPMGAPHSPARLEQDAKKRAYANAVAALTGRIESEPRLPNFSGID